MAVEPLDSGPIDSEPIDSGPIDSGLAKAGSATSQSVTTEPVEIGQAATERAETRHFGTRTLQSGDAAPPMRLRLKNNSVAVGHIVPSEQNGVVTWQNEGFIEPFHFELQAVRSVNRSMAAESPLELDESTFQVEMVGGDLLVGTIQHLDDQNLVIDSKLLGTVSIPRQHVTALMRIGKSGEIVYPGLIEQKPWTILSNQKDWHFRVGTLHAVRQGASIVGDLKLPSKCEISLSLSWKGVPDFVIHLGTSAVQPASSPTSTAARLEIWNRNVVLVREIEGSADLMRLAGLNELHPQLDLTILLDQDEGLIVVRDAYGQKLGWLRLASANPKVHSSILVANHGPGLAIERLEVRHWDGLSLIDSDSEDRIVSRGGDSQPGQVAGWAPDSKAFQVLLPTGESIEVPAEEVAVVRLGVDPMDSRPGDLNQGKGESESNAIVVTEQPILGADWPKKTVEETEENSTPDSKQSTESHLESTELIDVILVDQSRLKVQWMPGQNGKLSVYNHSLQRRLEFEPQFVASLTGTSSQYSAPMTTSPAGMLKIGESELAGYLTRGHHEEIQTRSFDAEKFPSMTVVGWNPKGSLSSSAWRSDAEGLIDFTPRMFPQHWPSPRLGEPTGRIDLNLNDAVSTSDSDDTSQPKPDDPPPESLPQELSEPSSERPAHDSQDDLPENMRATRQINFLSGDTIDGYVQRIDSLGVHFRSSQTQVRLVEHMRLNSLWLNSLESTTKHPPSEKLSRLMLIPRTMKDDPPSHLLVSVTGDWLRCRLIELDEKMATVETRRELSQIPREKVAQIIWLHQRDWDDENGSGTSMTKESESNVQAKPAEGIGLSDERIHVIQQDRGITFTPTKLERDTLFGNSELLGACSVSLKKVNRILFGPNLDQRIVEANENPWILSLAQSPRSYGEDGAATFSGQQSPLVGQTAPNFALSGLDGQTLRLSDLLGGIVVLEFWASWSEPCAQALPLVQDALSSFQSEQVQFLTINIQEADSRVAAAINRLGLTARVALDKDGTVTARYASSVIPQTVVIDPRGVVRYVFSGGGARLPIELTKAVRAILEEAEAP